MIYTNNHNKIIIANFGVEVEDFEDYGQFNNRSINLGFTLGLNDYWNISINQLISERVLWGQSLNLSHDYIDEVFQVIHSASVKKQTDLMNHKTLS